MAVGAGVGLGLGLGGLHEYAGYVCDYVGAYYAPPIVARGLPLIPMEHFAPGIREITPKDKGANCHRAHRDRPPFSDPLWHRV